MRTQFERLLAKRTRGEEPDKIREFLYMSYWYAGLYVVVEGWRRLALEDEEIDRLLASPNVGLLKRYRHGVFHFQPAYYDKRFVRLIDEGKDVVRWVRDLNNAFGRFLLEKQHEGWGILRSAKET